jgi:DNA adenine methylase
MTVLSCRMFCGAFLSMIRLALLCKLRQPALLRSGARLCAGKGREKLGRNWSPKYPCLCACGWSGKRTLRILHNRCPRCDKYSVRRLTLPPDSAILGAMRKAPTSRMFRAGAAGGYPGGKSGSGVLQTIVNLMPPHRVYLEPFLGGGSVMRFKRPADLSIGVDLDPAVVKDWRLYLELSQESGLSSGSVTIQQGCGIAFLRRYHFAGDELVYCDPPYVRSVRAGAKATYHYEMTDGDHVRLLRLLRTLPVRVIVSGYDSELYREELEGWHTVSFRAMTRGGPATEWLWMNYLPPVELHDYSCLGSDYRERERIKKKIRRWRLRLAGMPVLERQALLGAIAATAGAVGGARAAGPGVGARAGIVTGYGLEVKDAGLLLPQDFSSAAPVVGVGVDPDS